MTISSNFGGGAGEGLAAMRGHQSGGKGCGLRCPRFPCVKAAADKWDSLRRGGMIRTVPQPPDRKGRGVCDGEGAGLRDVLGGCVPERDGMYRYEDADAAFGPCARGDALQGVEHATVFGTVIWFLLPPVCTLGAVMQSGFVV